MDAKSMAESFLNSETGKKLSEKKAEISEIANSDEAKKIMDTLDKSQLEASIKNGNSDELKRIICAVLSTDEGKRLSEKLSKIIK